MRHDRRIIEAFRSNGIERVLVIDDVYDPPALDEISGDLLDYLESDDGKNACQEAGVPEPTLRAAVVAAQEGEHEAETLASTLRALYDRFVVERNPRFDPGRRFELLRAPGLIKLDPLITLLRSCGEPLALRLAGIQNGETLYRDHRPQVMFLDYYLGPDIEAGSVGGKRSMVRAQKASIDLLARLLAVSGEDHPAIVLMSSETVEHKAERFRRAVENQGKSVLALRFRFLQKGWVNKNGADLTIRNEAADALLDTSQGILFGQVLQKALTQWRAGAEDAMKAFLKEIGRLEPKDFAYLLRFRLLNEGERMNDYLEWMFGENLRALVDENVNWKSEAFLRLDDADLSKGIEGAFDGPSVPIAKIFHRIRIDEHLSRVPHRHALGDLYIATEGDNVRVIVTPDCDLVVRKGRAKAERILTMGGKLRSFDQDGASADEFVFKDGKPYSLRWNPKDMQTYTIGNPGGLVEGYTFAGTLRPLYAQEVQRQALADLSRIGLAVSPAMGVDASVIAWLRVTKGKGTDFQQLPLEGHGMATVLLERAEAGTGHKVLLRRSYVNALLDYLQGVDGTKLAAPDAAQLVEFLKEKNEEHLVGGLLVRGSMTKEKGPLGTRLAIASKPDPKKESPWLQILLELGPEAMSELLTVDPLLGFDGDEAEIPSSLDPEDST